MSAYLVSDRHINALVTYAADHEVWFQRAYCRGREQALAALLYAANVESVNYRYNETDETLGFNYRRVDITRLAAVDILKLCNGLEYQSCEHPGYDDSQARELLIAIKETAIRELPGYDDAPWGLHENESI